MVTRATWSAFGIISAREFFSISLDVGVNMIVDLIQITSNFDKTLPII